MGPLSFLFLDPQKGLQETKVEAGAGPGGGSDSACLEPGRPVRGSQAGGGGPRASWGPAACICSPPGATGLPHTAHLPPCALASRGCRLHAGLPGLPRAPRPVPGAGAGPVAGARRAERERQKVPRFWKGDEWGAWCCCTPGGQATGRSLTGGAVPPPPACAVGGTRPVCGRQVGVVRPAMALPTHRRGRLLAPPSDRHRPPARTPVPPTPARPWAALAHRLRPCGIGTS